MNSKNSKKLLSKLAPQQLEVLKRVCKGYPYKKIAKEMFISLSSVKTHMTAVYGKLELTDLSKDDRKFQIRLIYCPLLQELEGTLPQEQPIQELESEIETASMPLDEEEIIDVSQKIEPISQEEEEITDSDEEEIITYTPKPKKGGKEKMDPGKGRRRLKLVLVLIVTALIVFGSWQGWKWISNSFKGSSANAYEVGEWHKEDDMWIRLRDYELTNYDYDRIDLYLEIWNKSDQEVHFSWNTESNLELKDNIGTRYELTNRYIPGSDNETLLPQERSDLNPGLAKATAEYLVSPMFENGVTELLFSVDYLSRFEKVTWRIPVNK
jgi:hypothetical protein